MTFRVIRGGREDGTPPGLLVVGASEVVTLAGGLRRGGQADVGRLTAADAGGTALRRRSSPCGRARRRCRPALGRRAVRGGRRLPLGHFARLDALGGAVTPGLVDPHTHLLFAGSREDELELRQRGAGCMEILAAGGGILSTVARTRRDRRRPRAHGRRWLDEMLAHGTTTIEAKSGYGLDLQSELRLLEVAHELGTAGPVDVVPTYLGAHAVPPEFRDRPNGVDAYVRSVVEEQCRAWPPEGGRGSATCSARGRVLRRTVRADPSRRLGARSRATPPCRRARAVRRRGAGGGDRRGVRRPHGGAVEAGIDALAAAAADGQPVVATVLATTWFLMKSRHAPARTFIDRGIPVAIGTNFNGRPRRRRCRSR